MQTNRTRETEIERKKQREAIQGRHSTEAHMQACKDSTDGRLAL